MNNVYELKTMITLSELSSFNRIVPFDAFAEYKELLSPGRLVQVFMPCKKQIEKLGFADLVELYDNRSFWSNTLYGHGHAVLMHGDILFIVNITETEAGFHSLNAINEKGVLVSVALDVSLGEMIQTKINNDLYEIKSLPYFIPAEIPCFPWPK